MTTPSISPPPSSTCSSTSCGNAKKVLSKAQILDAVWEDGFDGDSNIVEIYISYLRKKIDCYDPTARSTPSGGSGTASGSRVR